MPLSGYIGAVAGILLLTQLGSCAHMSNLREQIGEERQKCETRLAEFRADKAELLSQTEREAEERRRRIVAELNEERQRMAEALHALRSRNEQVERDLTAALRRVEQEDREWADMLVPPYLLPD